MFITTAGGLDYAETAVGDYGFVVFVGAVPDPRRRAGQHSGSAIIPPELGRAYSSRQREASMNRLTRSLIWIGVAALVMLSPGGHLHATGGYTVVDLGALGGSLSFGYDINRQGQVTGEANYTGDANSYAFQYSNGAMTNLGVPPLTANSGGTNSAGWAINALGDVAGIYLYCPLGFCQPVQHPILYRHGTPIDIGLGFGGAAVSINDAGQVAGSLSVTGGTHLFLYSQGVTTDLGTLPNLPYATPYAMNSSGEIVGFSTKPYPNYAPHAFLYSNGAMTDIDLTSFGGAAFGINDASQVTGFTYTAGGITYHAFIYENGAITDLGTLAGFSNSASWGYAINAHGQVAGTSDTSDGGSHAFLYSNGVMSDLGTLGGSYSWPGNDFYVHAINGPGQVVGTSYLADNRTTHAFVSSGGMMADLNSLIPADSGWTLEVANAINDAGQITGYGYINGLKHAFLLTPTQTAAPATIGKAFGAQTIVVGNNTSLTFTLGNPNSTSLSGIAFTDPLPGGMVVASNGLTSTCGGTVTATAGSSSIALSGGSLAASGTCVISVTVTGVSVGSWNNVTGNVTSTEGGTGGTATANLQVTPPPTVPPTIAKAFGATSIPLGTNTTLTFTLANTNSTALSGVGFADLLPSGIIVATPNGLSGSCGGAVNVTTGSIAIVLTGGSIAAHGTCVISVTVTAVAVGSWTNVTGNVASTEGGTGGTATAYLQVSAPLPGCQGSLKSAYAQQYGGLNHAASALGFPSVSALVAYVAQVCGG
jgi:probable HAF family extracellular repeat protein